jgi:N-acetylglutamate synthase-like GNAT family acetyltransferase
MAGMPPVDVAAARARVRLAGPVDTDSIRACLLACDLTLAGVGSAELHLSVLETRAGQTVGVTGYESAGPHALIRSVAVAPSLRGNGLGVMLAEVAFEQAAAAGAEQLWLFSRRGGAFWQRLGFRLTPTDGLVAALPHTWQVSDFAESGQLAREIAWTRPANWPA